MNAFAQLAKRSKISKSSVIDVEDLEITNDPVITRSMPAGKYDELFSKMQTGQSLKCNPAHVNRIANALRKWLETKGRLDAKASSVSDYGDGFGRVWILPVKSAPAARPKVASRACAEAI